MEIHKSLNCFGQSIQTRNCCEDAFTSNETDQRAHSQDSYNAESTQDFYYQLFRQNLQAIDKELENQKSQSSISSSQYTQIKQNTQKNQQKLSSVLEKLEKDQSFINYIGKTMNKQQSGNLLWLLINFNYFQDIQQTFSSLSQNQSKSPSPQDWISNQIDQQNQELNTIQNIKLNILNQREDIPCKNDRNESISQYIVKQMTDPLSLKMQNLHLKLQGKTNTIQKPVVKDKYNDMICEICYSGDYTQSNEILICDQCDLGYHMKCCGVLAVPKGSWICYHCKLKNQNKIEKCIFCSKQEGTLAPVDRQQSAHIFCAKAIPNVILNRGNQWYSIIIVRMDQKRFKLKCQICKTRNGAGIQCQFKRCQAAFHPSCGQNLIIKEDKQLIIYCFRHQRIGINYKIESKKLEIARIILTKVSKEAIYYQNVKGFLKKINKIYEDDKFVKIGINSYGQFTCDDLKFNIIKPYMMVKYRLASKKYSNKIYNNLLKEIKNQIILHYDEQIKEQCGCNRPALERKKFAISPEQLQIFCRKCTLYKPYKKVKRD